MNDIRSLSSTDKALILFTLSAVNQIEIAAVTGIGFYTFSLLFLQVRRQFIQPVFDFFSLSGFSPVAVVNRKVSALCVRRKQLLMDRLFIQFISSQAESLIILSLFNLSCAPSAQFP